MPDRAESYGKAKAVPCDLRSEGARRVHSPDAAQDTDGSYAQEADIANLQSRDLCRCGLGPLLPFAREVDAALQLSQSGP